MNIKSPNEIPKVKAFTFISFFGTDKVSSYNFNSYYSCPNDITVFILEVASATN